MMMMNMHHRQEHASLMLSYSLKCFTCNVMMMTLMLVSMMRMIMMMTMMMVSIMMKYADDDTYKYGKLLYLMSSCII